MLHKAPFGVGLVVIDQAWADAQHVQRFQEGCEEVVRVGGAGLEGGKVGLPIGIGWWDAEELDADVLGVGLVEEAVHLAQRICAVDDEAQLRRAARTANASGDHLARQHLTQVADVEFTAGRDAGVDQMVGTLFNEACPDDVGPVDHVFTSDGNGSDDAAEGDVVDLVPHGFVDQHDGQHGGAARLAHGFNGP